jgi:hypothetical protein
MFILGLHAERRHRSLETKPDRQWGYTIKPKL